MYREPCLPGAAVGQANRGTVPVLLTADGSRWSISGCSPTRTHSSRTEV